MKRLLTWGFLCFGWCLLLARPVTADSLKLMLAGELKDSARAELLFELGIASVDSDVQTVLDCASQLKSLSERGSHSRAEMWSMNLISLYFRQLGDPASSLYFAELAVQEAEENGDLALISWAERQLAMAYVRAGEPETARIYLESSLQKVLVLGGSIPSRTFADFAQFSLRTGDTLRAEQLYLQAIDTANVYDPDANKYNLANLGHLYKESGRINEAIAVLNQSLEILQKENNLGGLTFVHAILGGCYNDLGEHRRALYHHLTSLQSARQQRSFNTTRLATYDVSQDYRYLQQYDSALYFSDLYIQLSDSFHTALLDNRITEIQVQNERDREEERADMASEIDHLEEDNRKNLILAGLAIGFLLAAGLMIFVSFRSRSNRRRNQQLELEVQARTQDLRATNLKLSQEIAERRRSESELSTLVYRSSHDIHGPLKSIQGLLYISRAEVEQEGSKLKEYMDLMARKVNQLDSVLSHLVEHISVTEKELIPESVPVAELWEVLRKDAENYPGFELQLEDRTEGSIRTDRAACLYILRSLLHNSFVFRNPDMATSNCRVEVKNGAAGYTVEVEDNGLGMEEEVRERAGEMFFRGTLNSEGSGLGLFIVGKILRRMDGSLSIESEVGKGTRVTIQMPHL